MNKRIREILKLIIKNPEMKLSTLTSELDLTRRQINYAINQFNEELKTKNNSVNSEKSFWKYYGTNRGYPNDITA